MGLVAPRWRRGGPRLAAAIALGATGLERSRSPAFGEKRLCRALARKLSMSMFDLFAIPLLTEGPTLTPPLLLRGSAVVATSCLHPRSSHTERTFNTWARSRLSPRLPLCADLQSPICVFVSHYDCAGTSAPLPGNRRLEATLQASLAHVLHCA